MKKIASFIVNKRVIFTAVFFVLMIFSVFSISWVKVEEDITVYLPDNAEAKRGLELMANEFVTYATADFMVEDVSRDEADAIFEDLQALENVVMVSYDDTSAHFTDNKALYSVTFDGAASDSAAKDGLKNVEDYLSGRNYSMYSDSFSSIAEILVKEMSVILVIVVIVVIAVLIFTSTTYIEPVVMLLTFVAAAVINMGTNFIMGTISFVSNSVAIVLQLALSVDYAIIYCNRYKQEHETKSIKRAAIDALAVSIPEIAASSLTTIAGLGAMAFMQFKLGLDMGICLIKAIIISLLSVFLFMPALIMAFGKLMDKTKHKSFVPKISFVGRFAYKTRNVIPVLFVVLVVFAYISFGNTKYAYFTDLIKNPHQNESDIAKEKIETTFGKNNLVAVIFPSGDYEKEKALVEELEGCREVKSVLSLASYDAIDGYCLGDMITYSQFMDIADVDETTAKALFAYFAADVGDAGKVKDDLTSYKAPLIDLFLTIHDFSAAPTSDAIAISPEQMDMIDSLYSQLQMAQDQLQGQNYNRMLVYINLTEQSDATFAFLERIHTIAEKYYPQGVVLTGNSVSTKDFADTFEGDITIVGFLSISLVMIILFITFKSFGMPLLLIIVIQGSIWLNFSIAVWTNTYVFFMCYLIVSAIQMGANIDYAIVISSRYNELRTAGLGRKRAIIDTINLTFPTVITSGTMMVVAGLLIGNNVSQAVIAGMGHYVGTGTAITLVLVNFVLPQILLLGDKFVRSTTVKLQSTARMGRVLRAAAAGVLIIAIAISGIIVPDAMSRNKLIKSGSMQECEEIIDSMRSMREIAQRIDDASNDDMKYQFAESLLTESIGAEQLEEGRVQLEEGEKQLADAKELYESGSAEYKQGIATYEAGRRELEAAEKLLAEGQAQYDEGLAQYEEGKAAYDAGKAQLDAVSGLYNLVIPYYNDYLSIQSQYDAAVASGDQATAASLYLRVTLAQGLYESSLMGSGYSISSLMSAYSDAQAQLADGEAQLAEAEIQLAEAKAQLDEGYAQYEEGKAQLDAGLKLLADVKKQLDDGAAQISDGEKQLEDAREEFRSGKEFLDENKDKLQSSLQDLEGRSEDEKLLMDTLKGLVAVDGVAIKLSEESTYVEMCSAVESYYTDELAEIRDQSGHASNLSAILLLAAALAAIALLLFFIKRYDISIFCAIVSAIIAAGCAAAWNKLCPYYDGRIVKVSLMLCIASVLFILVVGALLKAKKAENTEKLPA